jgi:protein TonB
MPVTPILALALVAAAAAEQASQVPSVAASAARARPARPIASFFYREDYPVSALTGRQEGRTAFRLTIGPNGRVTGCVVLGSSGSAALDGATCRVLRGRARFVPARDEAGRPTADDYFGEYTWRLPR